MGKEKTRPGLYIIVGGYLIYLAYQMYQNPDASQRSMVINVFMGLFFVIGIGLLIFGGLQLYQNMKHPQGNGRAEDAKGEDHADEAEEAEDRKSEDHADEAKGTEDKKDRKEIK